MPDTQPLDIAISHHQAGRYSEAHRIYREILAADPKCVSAWNLLGVMATQLGRNEVAVQCLSNAVRLKGDSAEIHYNMGMALQGLWKLDEAIAAYRRAIELDPGHARAYNNIGAALKEQGRLAEAVAFIREALRLNPAMAEAYCNLGNTLHRDGRWDEAREAFEKALGLDPDSADAHTNHAMVLLASGDFEHGWSEYDWRWKTGQIPQRRFEKPMWEGEPLAGRTILLHGEQGLGDNLQFIRYAPIVKEQGATVIVECSKALRRLAESCPGIDRVIGTDEQPGAFDFHAPLLSLPRVLKTTLETVPANVPYVSADAGLVAHWQERLEGLGGFRIGINWRGRTGQGMFRQRDIPLGHFAALTLLPVSLVCLQQDASPEELAEAGGGTPIFHPGEDFDRTHGAFMDTAAIMKNLDLVITSDTSLPHVAGALGASVWIALPRVAGWQWLRDRSDSPWYPTARLFRQKAHGDWTSVFAEIQGALAPLVGSASRGRA